MFPDRSLFERSNVPDSFFNRQKGSHMVLRREIPHARVVVPNHKQIRPGTLRQILNEAGLTVEQLLELL